MVLPRSNPLFKQLATSGVCRGLMEDEVAVIFELAEEKRVRSGEPIFREGDRADEVLVIGLGRVEISRKGERLASLGSGDVLGELSLLSRSHSRSATARALSDVALLVIPSARFRRLLEASSVPALKVVNNLAHQLAERLLDLNDKLVAERADRVDSRAGVGKFAY